MPSFSLLFVFPCVSISTLFLLAGCKDSFGLKPLDVVADLTAADLVERCLTRGRLSSSATEFDHPPRPSQGTIRHPSPSPWLPPKLESNDSAAAAVVGAGTTDSVTLGLSSPDAEGVPEGGGGEREEVQSLGETLTAVASAKRRMSSGDTLLTAKRGSWSRPVRPCPAPEGDTGIGDDTWLSPTSVKSSVAPTKRSKPQEDIGESEGRQRREVARDESGREEDCSVGGKSED